jgi:hypothetical protein
MVKFIRGRCPVCGEPVNMTGSNPHRYCSFKCYVDDNTMKNGTSWRGEKCWNWPDKNLTLRNQDTGELFDVRAHLLSTMGIHARYIMMACGNPYCTNPNHMFVTNSYEQYEDTVFKRQIGLSWE